MIALILILPFVAILFALKFHNFLQACRLCWHMKGPATLPLVGNTYMLLRKDFLTEIVATAVQRYGRICRIWISIIPGFVLFDPVDVQRVLSSPRHTRKLFVYRFLRSFLGTGLLTINDDMWRQHHRLISPAFHQRHLANFVAIFSRASRVMGQRLVAIANRDIDITAEANEYVVQVLHEAIFGMSDIENSVDFSESPFRSGQPTMAYRLSRPWLIFDWIYRLTGTAADEEAHTSDMRSFTRKIIAARRCLSQKEVNCCLLDFLLELVRSQNKKTFSETDVVEEAITFMLAGQDAVGAALGCSIFMLAQNPECQQKARNEIESIDQQIDKEADSLPSGNPLLYDRLRRMRYLEQCVNETLRLYPSVPLIARELGESLPIGTNGIILPAGSAVLIFPYALHRLPKYYADAERFDPDRFAAQRRTERHPYAFIPFSAGPRKCVGDRFAMLELQTILAEVLHRFDVFPVADKSTVRAVFRVTLRATGGLWVRLRPRKSI